MPQPTMSPLTIEKNSTLMNLPLMKHFSESEITTKIDEFRKGEKGLYSFLKLFVIIGLGAAFAYYALPAILIKVGMAIGLVIAGVILVGAVISAPVWIKWIRRLTRVMHENVIKFDPFAELADQRAKMRDNQLAFRAAKGKINALQSDMEIEADKNGKDCETYGKQILGIKTKADKLKSSLDSMVTKDGPSAKGTDAWVQGNADLMKLLGDSSRIGHQLKQAQDFVQKYGMRGNIMKKFGQKLILVETGMEIKLADFDATIEILKKDYEFAKKSREATETAKSAMMFTTPWELDYALEVVTSTIATDISITAGNLRDIDTLTSTYSMDSDELYTNLDQLSSSIKGGNELPSASDYANPEYIPSQGDKVKSGAFGALFQ